MTHGNTMKTPATKEVDPVFKIVDNVLKQVFGEKVTPLIYKYLETHYALKQNEFSTKIGVFAKGLENFLNTGAPIIERKILNDIYSSYGVIRKMDLTNAREAYDFAGQVRIAMQRA
jgi:hypothetical protein